MRLAISLMGRMDLQEDIDNRDLDVLSGDYFIFSYDFMFIQNVSYTKEMRNCLF